MSDSCLGNMLVSFFESYLKSERNLCPNTIISYSTCCTLFFEFTCKARNTTVEQLDVDHFSQELVLDFLSDLETTRHNSAKTRNLRLNTVRSLFRFLAIHNHKWMNVCNQICAIQFKKTTSTHPENLSKEEVEAFLNAPDSNTLHGVRDRALFYLLYATGARVTELVNLKIEDFQLHGPSPYVRILGKGRKIRELPLTEPIVVAVKTLLKQREQVGINHVRIFLNRRGEWITRFGIRSIIKSYCRRLLETCPSLKGRSITPHSFRHTSALHLLITGADLAVIKDYLGHADITTTHHYTKINTAMKAKALRKILPPLHGSQADVCDWKKPSMIEYLKKLQKAV